jgi:GNAT superfamily N-acetyltransferase
LQTEYTIRRITPADTDQILELLTLTLKGSHGIPRTREFWEWKHLKNPFGQSFAIAAEHNGKLIGLRMFMKWNWNRGGQTIPAVRAVDTVTHPDWQGKGIFSQLTTTLLEEVRETGISFVFNTPNSSSKPAYLKLGWQPVVALPMRIRILRPFQMIMNGFFNQSMENEGPENTALDLLSQISVESCLYGISRETRSHTERTQKYLIWRYGEIPGFQYLAKYKTKQNAEALLIYRNRIRKRWRELSISELLMTEGNEGRKLAKQLLEEALRNSHAHYAVALAADDTDEKSVLKQSWFFPVRRIGPTLTIRKLDDRVPEHDWSTWRCSVGDFEVF